MDQNDRILSLIEVQDPNEARHDGKLSKRFETIIDLDFHDRPSAVSEIFIGFSMISNVDSGAVI